MKPSSDFRALMQERIDGVKKVVTSYKMAFWLCEDATFGVAKPFEERPAANGNRTMIGLNAGSVEEVKRPNSKVLELGGVCERELG